MESQPFRHSRFHMEAAGSLTPALEGARASLAHTRRAQTTTEEGGRLHGMAHQEESAPVLEAAARGESGPAEQPGAREE